MKRSEALDLIKKQWNESTSFPSDQAVAEFILTALERAGMQPPRRQAKSWAELGIVAAPEETEQPRFIVSMWEDEDEA
jgi:hypothetical protein